MSSSGGLPNSGPGPAWRDVLARYGFAVLSTAAATGISYLLAPLINPSVLQIFVVAVAGTAVYGGTGPGFLSTVLSLLVTSYLYFSPGRLGHFGDPSDVARQIVFLGAGTVVSVLGGAVRESRRRADLHAAESERLAATATEAAERARAEAARAEEEAARAEEEAARVEEEAARAEEERLRAEEETLRAEATATELREANQRTLQILESITDGFVAIDREWHITYINPQAVQTTALLGRGREEILGRRIWDEFPDVRGTRIEQEYRRAVATRKPAHFEFLYEQYGLWFEIHAYPTPDGLGIFFRDVTERKRTEAALRESEERLRLALDAGSGGVWDWDVRSNRVTWSERVYALHGMPEGTFGGQVEDFAERIHPDDRERVLDAIRRAVVERTDYEIEFRVVWPTGEVHWLFTRGRVFYDSEGAPVRMVGVTFDATERRHAEQAIRESERQLRTVLDALPVGVWLTDDQGRIVYGNPAGDRIWSHLGRATDNGASGGRAAAPYQAIVERTLARGETVLNEALGMETPDGRRHVLASAIPILGEDRRAHGVLLVVEDITERRRIEDQLRQIERLDSVGRLAGGVAHEVNNQMSVVLGCADFVLRRPDIPDAVRTDVEQMRQAAERSAAVTAQLLAFSRRQMLRPELLDLNEIIAGFEPVLRRTVGEDIALRIKRAAALGRVHADRGQVEQVLLNLTLNARDAMPRGGTLTIETANVTLDETYIHAKPGVAVRPGSYVMLAVSDTGHGMDTETRRHIFEPFFTTKGPGRGTGLGLSTVYGIVKQSDGYIWVYSEPGIGSAFKIYLPGARQRVETAPPAVRPPVQGKETILLVEDEPIVRATGARALEAEGYTVLQAANGQEALELIRSHPAPIDLVVTDVAMPHMSGRQLATALARTHPDLPVLFTSGYTDDDIVRRGLLEADSPFLQKPFSPDSLTRRVREMLDEARRGV